MIIDTPIGPLTLSAHDGALTGLTFDEHHPAPPPAPDDPEPPEAAARSEAVLRVATVQLDEYFAGSRTTFDLPLRFAGTPFQQSVWEQLQKIPYGETITYGDLARRVGNPNAFRAVGTANGHNPVSIIVPCHRVVAAGQRLGGYGGGLDRKEWLLRHEGVGVLRR